ncbi:hypothetical protein Dimus_012124 [Dionaea muscipula]
MEVGASSKVANLNYNTMEDLQVQDSQITENNGTENRYINKECSENRDRSGGQDTTALFSTNLPIILTDPIRTLLLGVGAVGKSSDPKALGGNFSELDMIVSTSNVYCVRAARRFLLFGWIYVVKSSCLSFFAIL